MVKLPKEKFGFNSLINNLLFIQGHDTTGIALSNTLFCLGNNPEIQKKVQEEINDVFIDEDEPITKQKLAELKYLERVIKESLRILSSVPSVNRTLNHDVEIGNSKCLFYYLYLKKTLTRIFL